MAFSVVTHNSPCGLGTIKLVGKPENYELEGYSQWSNINKTRYHFTTPQKFCFMYTEDALQGAQNLEWLDHWVFLSLGKMSA